MAAKILDGRKIAEQIRKETAQQVAGLAAGGVRPGLAAVLVGGDPASEVYVSGKIKACQQTGIYSEKITRPDSVTTAEMLALIAELNARLEIDGILVQLPLPKQVDASAVLLSVAPEKDVDGFHPLNVGKLATGRPAMTPCTPAGILELLRRCSIPVAGREAVVVGRSDIVGKPTALLLLAAHATVTICHSRTRDLAAACRRADILVVAAGRPGLVTCDHVKPGATVIDVGMNRITDGSEVERLFPGDSKRRERFAAKGSLLVGDVHPQVAQVAGAITPVPGGVGPLTIAMLMANTVRAARLRRAGHLQPAGGER